jgi:hypothetical protein
MERLMVTQTHRFESLLSGFVAKRVLSSDAESTRVHAIRQLLDEFRSRLLEAERDAGIEAVDHRGRFARLLSGRADAWEKYREGQESVADDFNLLGVLDLTKNEVRHSMVLAWFLDRDLRKLGTHAQGNLGFRCFLSEAKLPTEYAACPYWVRREVRGDASIVDVEVASRGQFIIHIENKIWSTEGPDQTEREWRDLLRRAKQLSVPEKQVHALFLTPDGASPTCKQFQCISWSLIAQALHAFATAAKPQDVRLFANHYTKTLLRFIATKAVEVGGQNEIAL